MTISRSMLCVLTLAASAPLFGVDAPVRPYGTNANANFRDNVDRNAPDFVKASLLVMGPGAELYSCAGHACFRLECPKFNLDYCFSYESEAARARVLAFLAGNLKMGMFAVPTEEFVKPYREEGRGIRQYELTLPPDAKQRLWRLLDGKAGEGSELQYDFIRRGCAQSTLKYLFEAIRPYPIEYAPWPTKYERTLRELFSDALENNPWNLFVLQALVGTDVDADLPKVQRVIIPGDLAEFLKTVKVNGEPILQHEPTDLIAGTPTASRSVIRPVPVAALAALLLVGNVFMCAAWIDWLFLAVQALLGIFLCYLVFGSSLPATTWNWLLVPFNPLPLVFWKWRRYWALPFAAVLAAWVAFMVFAPHQLTDWAYVVLAGGFAVLYVGIWNRARKVEM